MTLADNLHREYRASQQVPDHRRCTIAKLLDRADDADRTALADALADPEFPSQAIARAIGIPGHTVRRHRRGDCSCNRKAAL